MRPLSGFVMVLSYSRAVFALFTAGSDAREFSARPRRGLSGVCRASRGPWSTTTCAVPSSNAQGTAIRFHPRLLELAGPLSFRAAAVHARPRRTRKARSSARSNTSAHAFFAARTFADVDDLNAQFRRWRDDDRASASASRAARSDRRRGLRRGAAAPLAAARASLRDRRDAHRWSPARRRTCASTAISYSIPHTHVRRPLTLLASADHRPRGRRHRRDRAARAQLRHRPDHRGARRISPACVAATRQANPSSARDRLRLAVPGDRHALRAPGRARRIAPRRTPPGCSRCSTTTARRNSPPPSTAALERDALGAGAIAHILETPPPAARPEAADPDRAARPPRRPRSRRHAASLGDLR